MVMCQVFCVIFLLNSQTETGVTYYSGASWIPMNIVSAYQCWSLHCCIRFTIIATRFGILGCTTHTLMPNFKQAVWGIISNPFIAWLFVFCLIKAVFVLISIYGSIRAYLGDCSHRKSQRTKGQNCGSCSDNDAKNRRRSMNFSGILAPKDCPFLYA
jgi:hypothetical protein